MIATVDSKIEPPLSSAPKAVKAILDLGDKRGFSRIALPLLGSGRGGLHPAKVARVVLASALSALPMEKITEITLTTLDEIAVDAVRNVIITRAQSFRNDMAQGIDLLEVENEVYALAEALLLRDLEPPIVVGILGGWGSGKSFVMHLLRQRMSEIRSMKLESKEEAWDEKKDKLFPYVGHTYLINFDAWSYAKSNLWASLMQTIFRELNRQLTLEKRMQKKGFNPLDGGQVWRALSSLDEREQDAFLESELDKETFESLQEMSKNEDLVDALWDKLRELKEKENEAYRKTKSELSKKRAKLEALKQGLSDNVDELIDKKARWAAWKPVLKKAKGFVEETFSQRVDSREDEEPPSIDQFRKQVHFGKKLLKERPTDLLGLAFFAVVSAILPFVLGVLQDYKLPGIILASGSAILAVMRTLGNWSRWFAETEKVYSDQVSEERLRLENLRSDLMQQLLDEQKQKHEQDLSAGKKLEELDESIPNLELQIRQLEARMESQQQRLGMTADFVSLADFVSARLDDLVYEKKLGLMHQVQRDLDELSNGLTIHKIDYHKEKKKEFFPRGPARVVLFIDDMDRCPPDRVVQVLEAAQLLVKTELFVVVMAMDVRYVTRALEKEYQGILARRGDPSGLDYIEKIVQIPYRIRPIDPNALPKYLAAQMQMELPDESEEIEATEPSGVGRITDPNASPPPTGEDKLPPQPYTSRDPLPTRVISFSAEELALVQIPCEGVGVSPRAGKRLVNIFKLMKIIWHRLNRYEEPTTDVKRAILLLLSLSTRYPHIMRDLFDEMSGEIEKKSRKSFVGFFNSYKLKEENILRQREWKEILRVVKDEKMLRGSMRLREIDSYTFNLVLSFSFVGDIGSEPPEYYVAADNEPYFASSSQPASRQVDVVQSKPPLVKGGTPKAR